MKKYLLLGLLFVSGCNINFGTKHELVYEKYPVYESFPKPVLQDISGEEMNPYKKVYQKVTEFYKDGIITPEERVELEKLIKEADENTTIGQKKVIGNMDSLIRWAKENQAMIDSYNTYANTLNKRLDVKEKK